MRLIQFAAALYGFCLAGSLALPSGSDAGSSAVLVKDSVILPRDTVLTGASITFHTNDEDKDGNSHLTITVKDAQKNIAAELDSDFTHFGDNNDNGPFNLDIFNPSSRPAISGGTVTIRLDPHGNDDWRFNWAMIFTFSDGSRLRAQANGVELSQNTREKTFNVVG